MSFKKGDEVVCIIPNENYADLLKQGQTYLVDEYDALRFSMGGGVCIAFTWWYEWRFKLATDCQLPTSSFARAIECR